MKWGKERKLSGMPMEESCSKVIQFSWDLERI